MLKFKSPNTTSNHDTNPQSQHEECKVY